MVWVWSEEGQAVSSHQRKSVRCHSVHVSVLHVVLMTVVVIVEVLRVAFCKW